MNIVVASGKGGTGKTTIATSLAMLLNEHISKPVKIVDSDVEAPNAHLVLKPQINQTRDASIALPVFSADICTGCKICVDVCRYHAIVMTGEIPYVMEQLCHGCGSCTLQCPVNAITEEAHAIGQLSMGSTQAGLGFAKGELTISEPMSAPVIRQLKQWQLDADSINILDAPPGASCPVVETLRRADFALLVTEPTPFGLHDLKQIIQLVQLMKIPHAVIINRSNLAKNIIEPICKANRIPILLRIPFDKITAEQLSTGKALIEIRPNLIDELRQVFQSILKLTGQEIE
ncbi:MAG: ATP-binding protein [Anaerolineaceae bacterium]|nr:ATP-binding protein [Anaerolineaceae bacterium]